jgi:hypothetical protein
MVTKGDAVLAAAPGHAVGVLDVERVDVPISSRTRPASERAMAANKKAGRNPAPPETIRFLDAIRLMRTDFF